MTGFRAHSSDCPSVAAFRDRQCVIYDVTVCCAVRAYEWFATLFQPIATPSRSFMHRRLMLLAASALAAALFWPAAPMAAAPAPTPTQADGFAFFPQTGHNVGLAIKRFYDAHGGLDIFGLPLTELFDEDGLKVQYFERARFELHPE